MDFKEAARLGSYISKDYAEDLFRLLATYSSISASEAASRLELHVKTAQDFLEAMFDLGLLEREEVYEKKRPYFRYILRVNKIAMELDLSHLFPAENKYERTSQHIREIKDAGARFTTARSDQYISHITIWTGKGRDRTEKKINLSIPQGKFLFHLPFPTASFRSIESIMQEAGVDSANTSEVLDIIDVLFNLGVIEKETNN
jgi:predicted transcriptional regulator